LKTLGVNEAREKLPELVEDVLLNHEPMLISGINKNAVLVAESDWQAMNETLHLLSVPGMRDAIQSSMSENILSTSKELKW
jgi:antitoxin YefM